MLQKMLELIAKVMDFFFERNSRVFDISIEGENGNEETLCFTVDGLNHVQADRLLDLIVKGVESENGMIGAELFWI